MIFYKNIPIPLGTIVLLLSYSSSPAGSNQCNNFCNSNENCTLTTWIDSLLEVGLQCSKPKCTQHSSSYSPPKKYFGETCLNNSDCLTGQCDQSTNVCSCNGNPVSQEWKLDYSNGQPSLIFGENCISK